MADDRPTNVAIAAMLERIAELLAARDANDFRVRAYRNAAATVEDHDRQVADLVDEGGREALQWLPGVGRGIAGVIASHVRTGRSSLLDELMGEVAPEDLFAKVPGIGEELAHRVVDELGVSTLEELEEAAHDGRLASVAGFGPARVRSVRYGLAGMLGRSGERARREAERADEPDVGTLLDVDEEYRRKAAHGGLRTIAPKRFNPQGKAWLPILNTERNGWSFTALFSNTARAHELGKTDDWVVLYVRRNGRERQATVVTGIRGELTGKRIVRGREEACRRYYR